MMLKRLSNGFQTFFASESIKNRCEYSMSIIYSHYARRFNISLRAIVTKTSLFSRQCSSHLNTDSSRTPSRCVIYKLLSSFSIFNFVAFLSSFFWRLRLFFSTFIPFLPETKSALNVNKQQLKKATAYAIISTCWLLFLLVFISTAHETWAKILFFLLLSFVDCSFFLWNLKWRTFQKLMKM